MRDLEETLRKYADLAVHVGLNLQRGQAPLVRCITESAYRAGARFVETLWGDEALQLARFRLAPPDSFDETSRWLGGVLLQHVEAGDAVLSIYANDPDLLKE